MRLNITASSTLSSTPPHTNIVASFLFRIDWDKIKSIILLDVQKNTAEEKQDMGNKLTTYLNERWDSKEKWNEEFSKNDEHVYIKLSMILEKNKSPAFQNKWRRTPYPERIYSKIENYVLCDGLEEEDKVMASREVESEVSYRYDAMRT